MPAQMQPRGKHREKVPEDQRLKDPPTKDPAWLEDELRSLRWQRRHLAERIGNNPGSRELVGLSREFREVQMRYQALKAERQPEQVAPEDEVAALRAARRVAAGQ